jgi:hypothetical protein
MHAGSSRLPRLLESGFGFSSPTSSRRRITSVLAELGFHWNNARQAWQHPCGTVQHERAAFDPRKRYRSYFAADAKTV